jgi:hypothetical protein
MLTRPACLPLTQIDPFQAVIQMWLTNIKYNLVNWSSVPPDRYLGSDCRRIAFAFAMSGIRG